MSNTQVKLQCPKCSRAITAEVKKAYKFVIYKCPECDSNVVYYNNKVDIISDAMVNKLIRTKKLKLCGHAVAPKRLFKRKKEELITRDMILNLKILLETETDFDKLISKL